MTIPQPNLTFTVTPPGGTAQDYTKYLAWGGSQTEPTITQNFGRQGDTAVFPLVDDYQGRTTPNFHVPVLSQVKLFDNTLNKTLFAGVVNDPILDIKGPTMNEWSLQCTDYTFYADNIIVNGVFNGFTADQIIVRLTQQANCGITAKKVSSGGFVAPAPQLAAFVLNYSTLAQAWRKLSQLAAQSTPYGWYVDENRNLHFYDATTAINSGVTFTTNLTTPNGSTTQGHIKYENSFGYEWDGTSIRNRILVQGANQIVSHGSVPTSTPTDTFRGNGAQTSWALRHIVTGSPSLRVNGIATSVTVVEAGASSNAAWQIIQNSVGTWFLVRNGSAPANGVTLKVWYDYEIPVLAQANDYPSQTQYTGPNRGIYEEYINDTSLTTVSMALARAQRQRTEYAFAPERFTFTTGEDFYGWIRSGETFKLTNQYIPDSQNNYSWGLTNQTFICINNTVSFGVGGYRRMRITGIRL